ncbi:hypothetical protein EDB82DRAFT_248578 [Fusarium venenatum]|uniref:uncharacterized protein n=1 Tax=Fusarium venenatum TaxID=56646 RepID=UPI001D45DC86|nr:hypothetical protein EDB82DRAFT_248578 [Fusarium venenatum]
MRRHLKAWLEVRKSRSKNEVDPAPQMPCLTSPRPRVLTPSSSKQDLSLPLQSSPLFSKLPTEIRRRILLFAFGDRTVHMDLALEHPFKAKAPALSYDHRHGKLDTLWRDNLDRSRPRIWKWKGCVCHRVGPPRIRKIFRCEEYVCQPADDNCCSGRANFCHGWKDHYGTTDACLIGVMGWLLSCRQSCVYCYCCLLLCWLIISTDTLKVWMCYTTLIPYTCPARPCF